MSLVDDLLIEAERRRGSARAPRGVRIDDLVPIRKGEASRAPSDGPRALLRPLGIFVAFAGLAAIVALAPIEMLGERLAAISPPDPQPSLARPPAPPAVAAPPVEAPFAVAAAPASSAITLEVARPVRVDSIALERLSSGARLRIIADAETPHRIDHAPGSDRFDVVLSGARLAAPEATLDLLDTPIRSLDLQAAHPDLRIALELDPEVRVQSRWLALPTGAALIIELQAPAAAAIDAFADPASMGPEPDALAAAALPFSIDREFARSERPRAPEPADRVISPPLGDPAELRIERSSRDQAREQQRALRERIEAMRAEALRARSAGRIEEAEGLYGEIVRLAPGDPQALVDWSELLAESGRTDEAITLVERARERAPREAFLLLTQARLLGRKGDLARAIEILDTSGLAVTESPDVHALAAAYHQRAGDHATAIERYERLLRRFPEESRGWLGLGISLEAVGRRDEARDVYRIALQVGELPTGSRRWLTTRLSALGQED